MTWSHHFTITAYACVNPPQPDPAKHIILTNYTAGAEISFGSNIRYECENGYYFDHNKDLEGFNVECQAGGAWSTDANVGGKFCVRPEGKCLIG